MKVFIPNVNFNTVNSLSIFILTRPFFSESGWCNDDELKRKWNVINSVEYTSNISEARFVLIPHSINWYFEHNSQNELIDINSDCKRLNIKAYGIIVGDLGISFPDFSNIYYFRMGGFKSQLSSKNMSFPFSLSDQWVTIFKSKDPIPNQKNEVPVIGFCGHASFDISKKVIEKLKFFKENCFRLIKNPFRNDFEPLFASAFERACLLRSFEKSSKIKTNFIYRNHYRAGAKNEKERRDTTIEYYNNLKDSDYILCLRGAGNFSVRLYETLMMGKIPIFINTDCILPFEDKIDWKNHVVWVEWEHRKNCAAIVSDFHANISNNDFIRLQESNRRLWKNQLSVSAILEKL